MHAFLGTTCHYFSDTTSPALQSSLLQFQKFSGSHTGVRIADYIQAGLKEYQLNGKTVGIVADNASNMRKALQLLESSCSEGSLMDSDENTDDDNDDDGGNSATGADDNLWQDISDTDMEAATSGFNIRVACFAHTLQLTVRDGLDHVHFLRPVMGKCSKLSNLVHQSAMFRASFEQQFGSGHSIPVLNDTRWNSTYRQYSAILSLDKGMLRSLLTDVQMTHLLITEREYDQLSEVVNILAPFADATDLTQGDHSITISCVLPAVLVLNRALS